MYWPFVDKKLPCTNKNFTFLCLSSRSISKNKKPKPAYPHQKIYTNPCTNQVATSNSNKKQNNNNPAPLWVPGSRCTNQNLVYNKTKLLSWFRGSRQHQQNPIHLHIRLYSYEIWQLICLILAKTKQVHIHSCKRRHLACLILVCLSHFLLIILRHELEANLCLQHLHVSLHYTNSYYIQLSATTITVYR